MRKEFGKWLMDIAKYITTAVILTSIFGEIDQKWIIYVGGIISILLTLSIGLWLVRDKKEKGKWYGSFDYVWVCVAHCKRWRHLFLFGRQERNSYSLEYVFAMFYSRWLWLFKAIGFLLYHTIFFISRYSCMSEKNPPPVVKVQSELWHTGYRRRRKKKMR